MKFLTILLIVFFILACLIHFMIRRYHAQNKLIQAELHLQTAYIDQVKHVHILQHDIKNHMFAIENLYHRGENEKALLYIADLRKKISDEYRNLPKEELSDEQ